MLNAKPIVEFLTDKPKYLRLSSNETPKWKDSYGYVRGGQKIKNTDLCITGLTKYHEDYVQISYLNENVDSTYVIVPNDFLVSILPPDKLAEMESKYALAAERQALRQALSFQGSCGSDPEIFVEDKSGEIIPAFKFLGPKDKPFKTSQFYGSSNNVYWDGFQAEFDTYPNVCFSGQADSIHYGLQGVLQKAREYDKDAKLAWRPVMEIPPHMLIEAAPEHVQFGCMPSLNAYGMTGDKTPGHEVPFRPAGGHMHFGVSSMTPERAERIVKAMDAILGVACVSLFDKYDDARRRKLYGLAGEYRLPKHGIEYRVLSNAWLIHPLLAHIVFDLGRTAAKVGDKDMLSRWECPEAETVRIINEHDVEGARKVLAKNEQFLKRLIEIKYAQWWAKDEGFDYIIAAEYVYKAIMNGLDSIIADPHDIEGNWNLLGKNGEWTKHSDGPGKNVMFVFKHKLQDKKV